MYIIHIHDINRHYGLCYLHIVFLGISRHHASYVHGYGSRCTMA